MDEARGLADAAYYNLLVAAISTVRFSLLGYSRGSSTRGTELKGILLLHLVLALFRR